VLLTPSQTTLKAEKGTAITANREHSMIELAQSAAAFFRECLESALRRRRVSTSELVESYLVQLLTDLANPRRGPTGPGASTLVEMLRDAQSATGAEKARLYRELGDSALLWSGVFRERLLHRGMSLSYYESIGQSAYHSAGHLHRLLRNDPIDELCLELGAKFPGLSNALDEAATLGVDGSDAGLVKMLDRFSRAGRPWMHRALMEGGVDPDGLCN
jgi:hypothetical protein